MNKKILINEMLSNHKEIIVRLKVIFTLLNRLLFKTGERSESCSYQEYDHYWDNYLTDKDYLRKDLIFYEKGKNVIISPHEYKKKVIIKTISNIISKYKIKSVLEIGSGSGINLLLLAQIHPDVEFIGLEPTKSGITVSHTLMKKAHPDLDLTSQPKNNVTFIHGSIINTGKISRLMHQRFDLVFTAAVLEQLYDDIDRVFITILKLRTPYFLFIEEWLEANLENGLYEMLVKSDYFRLSWNYLDQFKEIELVERYIPEIQPGWLHYGLVFYHKTVEANKYSKTNTSL